MQHLSSTDRSPYGKVRICSRFLPGDMVGMNWKSIRLELAKTGQFPAGSVSRAYLISLPLNDQDTVDRAALRKAPAKATVRRHWSTEPDQRGVIVSSGCDWAMRSDSMPERVLQLDGTPLRLGQQVSIIEPDGSILPFNIASVR